jgi:hypothetical protein
MEQRCADAGPACPESHGQAADELCGPVLLLLWLLSRGQRQFCQNTQAALAALAAQGPTALQQLPRPLVMRLGNVTRLRTEPFKHS